MPKKKKMILPHIVFLGPAFVLFTIAMIIPLFLSLYYSFTDWNGISTSANFVGFENYQRIFSGKTQFTSSIRFTLLIGLAIVVLTVALGMALAALLEHPFPGSSLFRAMFFLPNTMGGVVMGYIWRFIFIMVFAAAGKVISWKIFQLPWLGTPGTAYAALIIVSVWQGAGYVMTIMIAALMGVPKELSEAARVDGAGGWTIFWKVKLPQCAPYVTVCLFWSLATTLKMFDVNVSLTKGGPYGVTTSMAQQIYTEAFGSNKYGLANAESIIFFLILLAITSVQLFFSRKQEEQMG